MSTPSHSNKSKMTSADACKLARENLHQLTGELVPAPPWNDAMDTSERRPPSITSISSGEAPPAKDRRLHAPDELIVDDSQGVVPVSSTPDLVTFPSAKAPGTPPMASAPLSKDQIAAMMASSLEKARRDNQAKVEADKQKLLKTMCDNNRRER